MKSFLLSAISAFALWVAPASSFAACGVPDFVKARAALSLSLPPVAAATSEQAQEAVPDHSFDPEHAPIVGLWDIKFYSGGQLVDEGFDAWHSDSLELLNDTPPPATGNVCVGVFAQTGHRRFKLKHPSWIFDSTNTTVIGTATIRESVKVDKSGDSFSGTFTLDIADTFGNPLGEEQGSVTATRIKAD